MLMDDISRSWIILIVAIIVAFVLGGIVENSLNFITIPQEPEPTTNTCYENYLQQKQDLNNTLRIYASAQGLNPNDENVSMQIDGLIAANLPVINDVRLNCQYGVK